MWIIISTICLFNECHYAVETDISYFSEQSCQATVSSLVSIDNLYELECVNLMGKALVVK